MEFHVFVCYVNIFDNIFDFFSTIFVLVLGVPKHAAAAAAGKHVGKGGQGKGDAGKGKGKGFGKGKGKGIHIFVFKMIENVINYNIIHS